MCCDWVILECITFGVQVIMQCLYAEKKYSVHVAENDISPREKVCRLDFSKIRNISRYKLGSHMFIVIQLWTAEGVIE